ncbi:hypothetical protein [Spongiibacter marinus]|uniref:hypothetical protein n=1 Tax=Spongiibacter marinus TaxID=354246 RepID=UPI0004155827|nr:hypothetical protein [Spongiibacter marinus]
MAMTRTALVGLLLRWHMRLGALVSVGIIAWGLSGLAHPIISRLQPVADQHRYPLSAMSGSELLSPAHVLQRAGIAEPVTALRLVDWGQGAQYRVALAGQVLWLDARSAELLPNAEQAYATQLARHFSGDLASPVAQLAEQRQFSEDYLFINRLLPVQRVAFARDDELRVYVDTASGRLAAMVDANKAAGSALFRNLHNWLFIPNEQLRHGAMLVFLFGGIVVGVMGAGQYVMQARSGRGWRRGSAARTRHRRLGIAVALTTVTFSVSGAWHLLQKHNPALRLATPSVSFSPNALSLDWGLLGDGIRQAELVAVQGQPYFRVWQSGELSYVHAASGEVLAGGEAQHARELASYYSGNAELGEAAWITRFEGEYGFINKRLPVVAFENLQNGDRYYVEPRSGVLAAHVRDSDRAEGWSFAWLHKWHFLDGLGRDARDAVAALFALGIAASFALGVFLYCWRLRQGKPG